VGIDIFCISVSINFFVRKVDRYVNLLIWQQKLEQYRHCFGKIAYQMD
jgi:hypothetical protein